MEKLQRLKDEQISRLEKDVYYYKHKKKELEMQVKQIIASGDRTLDDAEDGRRRVEQLASINRSLMTELARRFPR